MTWFKVDDGFWSHPKTVGLSDAAVALWVRAGAYACQHLTDGAIPAAALRMVGERAAADELVASGLWVETAGGYAFHDWAEYQETSDAVKDRRAAARERQRRSRAARAAKRGDTKPNSQAHSGDVPPDVTEDVTRDDTREFLTPDPTVGRVGTTSLPPYTEVANATSNQAASTNVSTDRARDENETPPRGPVVDVDGWKLVRDEIPDTHPTSVRTELAMRAGALLKSGTPEADVRQALSLWLDKPKLGPATLPSLVSEVVRNRARPAAAAHAEGAATTKARGWLDVANQLDPAVATAAPSLSPSHPRAIEP
ncbi:hypothetical protein [Nocardia wallacei]|uniref:hypothetical protein n=2 Tax=Nocardia wallacei TaxID=480035 RepID=UPI002456D465|nr:hypothetical protein [Nocardia wallacei]